MSTDLHAQLVAAVNARLEVARAYLGACRGGHGWCGDDEYEEFQQTGDPDSVGPDSVVRHCERDLRVLERHQPFEERNWSAARGSFTAPACQHCQLTSNDGDPLHRDWPCPDVRDLAVAYGLLDPTAGE